MLYYKTYQIDENADWVVFVHGAGGSSAIWYKQIKQYSKNFNLLLIDLRGHGNTAKESPHLQNRDYTFESITLDIVEVLDHLHIRKAHFVGVSLGTIIIRQLAELKGDYVKTMVLCGAITRLNLQSRFYVGFGRLFRNILPYMWLYKIFAFVIMPRKGHAAARNFFIREAKKLCQSEFIRWFKLTARINPFLRSLEERDLGIPTLYVMGEEDHLFLRPIEEMIDKHSSTKLEVVEKCGHVVNIEKADLFNDISLNFLRQNGSFHPETNQRASA